MTTTSVCLIGEESILKEGIKSLLSRNNFNIAADYDGLATIPSENAENQLEQLIVSIDEGADGLSKNIHRLKNIYPQSRIVVMSGNTETSVIMSAFDVGVDGLILKDISCEGLIGALKLVAAGEKVYPANMQLRPIANSNSAGQIGNLENYNLSRCELRIVHCLANGEPNKVIAHQLNITEATVKVHVRTILRKLGMANRTKAAIFAIAQGIAPAPKQAQASAR